MITIFIARHFVMWAVKKKDSCYQTFRMNNEKITEIKEKFIHDVVTREWDNRSNIIYRLNKLLIN